MNIDHVATVRQARYRAGPGVVPREAEPDVVRAAHEAVLGGADGITVHLREDRRHIQDQDVEVLRGVLRGPVRLNLPRLNLEMGAAEEMVGIARRIKPDTAMLVPEGRQEVTTEGGLDVAGQAARMKDVVTRLKGAGMVVSAFIDAEEAQVGACTVAGFDVCEVHTGPYARAFFEAGGDFGNEVFERELERVRRAGARIISAGMRFNAGHALNYQNVRAIAGLPGIAELHIGHAIVSRAVFVGLRTAVAEMKAAMAEGWAAGGGK